MIQMDERARIIEVFRKNLANLISERNLTQREFAKMVGVSAPTVNDWLKGKTSPRMNKIDKICSIFAIKRSDLLDPPAEPAPPAAQPPTAPYRAPLDGLHGVKIPILGRVVAGLPAYADQEILGYDEITKERAQTGEFFSLIVRGDSMEPLFLEGDHVIVERQPDVDSGDVAIVGVDGEDATIKRVQKVEGGIILQPENRSYNPMYFSEKDILEKPITIYGRVVEQRRTKF